MSNKSFFDVCVNETGALAYLFNINSVAIKIYLRTKKKIDHQLLFDNTLITHVQYKRYSYLQNDYVLCIIDSKTTKLELKCSSYYEPTHAKWRKNRRKQFFECLSVDDFAKDVAQYLDNTNDIVHLNKLNSIQDLYTIIGNTPIAFDIAVCLHSFAIVSGIEGNINNGYILFQERTPNGLLSNEIKLGRIIPFKYLNNNSFTNININKSTQMSVLSLSSKFKNTRACVSLLPRGLNLLYRLGYFESLSAFQTLANQLNSNTAFVYFNQKHKMIDIQYYDINLLYDYKHFNFDVSDQHKWHNFFDYILLRQTILERIKQKQCAPLFKYLQQYNSTTTLFKSCYRQIQQYCKQIKIIFFDIEDGTYMHYLKQPFVACIHPKRLNVEVTRDSVLTGLYNSHIKFQSFFKFFSNEINPSKKDLNKMLNQIAEDLSLWSINKQQIDVFVIKHIYHSFCKLLLYEHKFDFNTLTHLKSLSQLSYNLIWNDYINDPFRKNTFLFLPLEKISPITELKLRSVAHGGFLYSCKEEIKTNDLLNECNNYQFTNKTCKSLWNLDICSSYGFSGASCLMPTGFGIVYCDNIKQNLYGRHNSFEFRAVFYILYNYFYNKQRQVRAVYSNFSPLGIFYINKYPMDLVIFTQNKIDIFQFDGRFIHGCTECKLQSKLKSYINNESEDNLIQKTSLRNTTVQNWISMSHYNVEYHIIKDCCGDLTPKQLKRLFLSVLDLYNLSSGYSKLGKEITCDLSLCPDELTFLSIVDIQCKNNVMIKYGPLMIWQKDSKTGLQTQIFTNEANEYFLTKDYFMYLQQTCQDIIITRIHWIVFYKIDNTWPHVFDVYLNKKVLYAKQPILSKFYKSIVNLSCGMFGFNLNANNYNVMYYSKQIPKTLKCNTLKIYPIVFDIADDLYLIKSKKVTAYKPSFFPLPLFNVIVDYGRQRINTILYIYEKCLCPSMYKLLYINTDSTIITLAETSFEAITKENIVWHQHSTLIMAKNRPGYLKLEWKIENDPWKFISPYCGNYAVLSENKSLYRMTGINELCTTQIYECQKKILQNENVVLCQKRKMCSLSQNNLDNTAKRQVMYNYKPK